MGRRNHEAITLAQRSDLLPASLLYRYSQVFSTDWSFGGGQDECRFGDGADSLRAQADAVERLPAGLEQRDPAFTLGAQQTGPVQSQHCPPDLRLWRPAAEVRPYDPPLCPPPGGEHSAPAHVRATWRSI